MLLFALNLLITQCPGLKNPVIGLCLFSLIIIGVWFSENEWHILYMFLGNHLRLHVDKIKNTETTCLLYTES